MSKPALANASDTVAQGSSSQPQPGAPEAGTLLNEVTKNAGEDEAERGCVYDVSSTVREHLYVWVVFVVHLLRSTAGDIIDNRLHSDYVQLGDVIVVPNDSETWLGFEMSTPALCAGRRREDVGRVCSDSTVNCDADGVAER